MRLTFPVACLLALLFGAVCIFGFAPFFVWWLPIVAYAVWFWLLSRFASPRQALILGACFGFAYFASGVGWLYISLNHYGGVPPIFAVLAVALFAAYLAIFPVLAAWFVARQRLPRWALLMALPAACGLSEWLRGWLFSGFPWLALGYTQIPLGFLAGYVPLIGIYGVGYLLLTSAAALVLVLDKALRARLRLGLAACLLLVWIGGYLLQGVAWTHPVGDRVSVALLQGNIAQDQKWQEEALKSTFARYSNLILTSSQRLIVLPETALPVFMHDIPPEFLEELRAHAVRNGSDILLGVPSLTDDRRQYYNSVTSLGVSPEQLYRKIHLVPFGEFIPFKSLLGGVYQSLNIPLTDFASGKPNQGVMQVAGQKLLINICYEDVFGEELLSRVKDATLLLNVTNDAWYDRSPAAHQHLQIAQARSAETGRYMLRATNTGMTAVIDQRGRLQQVAPWFRALALNGWAQGYQGQTPYVRFGNWPVVLWMSIFLAGAIFRQRLLHSSAAAT